MAPDPRPGSPPAPVPRTGRGRRRPNPRAYRRRPGLAGTTSQASTSAFRRWSKRSASERRSSPATAASIVQPPCIASVEAAARSAPVLAATASRPARRGERHVIRGASRTRLASRRDSRASACGVSRPTRSSTRTDSPHDVGWAVPHTIRHRPPARPTSAALVQALPTSSRSVSSVSGMTRTGDGARRGRSASDGPGAVKVAFPTRGHGRRCLRGRRWRRAVVTS